MEPSPLSPEEREKMIEALTLEDLEYVARNPEDAKSMVSWFAKGGWTTASDETLRLSFQEIQDNG